MLEYGWAIIIGLVGFIVGWVLFPLVDWYSEHKAREKREKEGLWY